MRRSHWLDITAEAPNGATHYVRIKTGRRRGIRYFRSEQAARREYGLFRHCNATWGQLSEAGSFLRVVK